MTDDLSTRLLEEIAAKERAIKRVMEGAWWLNDYIDEAGQAWLDEWANEALALRLCQAHREIVELHMVCQADAALATEGLERLSDVEAAERFLMQAGANEALVRSQLSEHYLDILALAYEFDTPREGE